MNVIINIVYLQIEQQLETIVKLYVAWWIYGDLLVILGSPRVTYYTSYMFDFSVNISSMYHIKSSVKVV